MLKFFPALALSLAALQYGSPAWAASAEDSCAALSGMQIPSSAFDALTDPVTHAKIAVPGAVVQSASFVAADAVNGDYCAVRGAIKPVDPAAPDILFAVNLPARWNGRALQMGGAGFDGSLVTGLGPHVLQLAGQDAALKQGYVTLGSDGGHEAPPGFDASFALNDESFKNFGQWSIKKTHDAALAIVKAHYGMAPIRFYFIGGSQGGHEALDAAGRYYQDYDGVIANYPAYNVTLLHLGSLNAGRAIYGNGGANWMDPAHVKLLTDAVYKACDGLDGTADGIIANVGACRKAFKLQSLACPGGGAGADCLSAKQIEAVRTVAAPYEPGMAIQGMKRFAPWPVLEGALFSLRSTFGAAAQPSNPPAPTDALLYAIGSATTRFILTKDTGYDAMTFDPRAWTDAIRKAAAVMDSSALDFGPFFAKGGKLILTHGTADDFITPYNTVDLFDSLRSKLGKGRVDAAARFYRIPGMGHGFGPYVGTYDGLGLLTDWVEKGIAPPDAVPSLDGNKGAARGRPLCRYPAWPKFMGGSPDDAASFTCVTGG